MAANKKRDNIKHSGYSIYNPIAIGDPKLWLSVNELAQLLDTSLKGISLAGLPNRTRSKKAKELVCEALGYQKPKSFQKVQPRFSGQRFDIYVQKSNNLQIWNEELSPDRRYVLIRVNDASVITKVKVVNGFELVALDTTGKLTQKFQATISNNNGKGKLVSQNDTPILKPIIKPGATNLNLSQTSPVSEPNTDDLYPISTIYTKLKPIVGAKFKDPGADQERNRGAELHKLVCKSLGYSEFRDNGQFPDVMNQLLEVKLQTSPTIDLGLVTPESTETINIKRLDNVQPRHCDVRYAIFTGDIKSGTVTITNFYLTTGVDFFSEFPQCKGNIQNKKIQIMLPSNFFS